MAQSEDTTAPRPEKVKLPITGNTVLAASTVGVTAGIGPQIVKPIVEWAVDILAWAAPGFPLPNQDGIWSIACLIVGALAAASPLILREQRLNRRATDFHRRATDVSEEGEKP